MPPVPYGPTRALTYDRRLVPAGAWIRVEQRTDAAGTTVTARLEGLRPGQAYGAHVHTGPCGADPKAAGGHYQHVPKPEADPRNEVWLDFTADAHGSGVAGARQAWGFRPGGAASVVLHDEPGGAGARIACFTVPFAPRGSAPERPALVRPVPERPALVRPVPEKPAPESPVPENPAPARSAPGGPAPAEKA